MGSLWQFFGLPDPEGHTSDKRRPKKVESAVSNASEPKLSPQQTFKSNVAEATVKSSAEQIIQLERKRLTRNVIKPLPLNWSGPLTAEGEAFHDLGAHVRVKNPLPRRALRYVSYPYT